MTVSEKAQLRKSERSSNLPLTEKYRPRALADVIGQEDTVAALRRYVEQYKKGEATMPHLLFYGPAGTGKTSCAQALARELYGDEWRQFTLDANASDDRGIDFVRGRIKEFARSSSLGQKFNLIILDEFDHTTSDAQAALRRTMEDFASNCRFVLCCNEVRKVIPPIQSRCSRFQFQPVPEIEVGAALQAVCTVEGIPHEPGAISALVARAKGGMRDALNLLESAPRPLTVAGVESVTIDPSVWESIIAKAVTGDCRGAEKQLIEQLYDGASANDVFQGFYDALSAKMPEGALNVVLPLLGDREYFVASGGNLELQARCYLRQLAKMATK